MATRIITVGGKKIRHERITKKNGKVYDYFYEVSKGGKKKGQKQSFKSIYGTSLQVKEQKEKKLTYKQKKEKIFTEFGDTPTVRKKLRDIEEKYGKNLSYKSLSSRMIGISDLELDDSKRFSEVDRARKLIRNLGYTEDEFQQIYGISASQLSEADYHTTGNGEQEVTINGKVYGIKWNYTGYEDLVYLRDA